MIRWRDMIERAAKVTFEIVDVFLGVVRANPEASTRATSGAPNVVLVIHYFGYFSDVLQWSNHPLWVWCMSHAGSEAIIVIIA